MTPRTIAAIAGGVGLAAFVLWPRRPARRRSTSTVPPGGDIGPDEGEEDEQPVGGFAATPILKLPNGKPVVGEATQPDVAAVLAEYDAFLAANGVDTNIVSAFDVTVMPKAPLQDGWDEDKIKTRPVAIPERASWSRMATLLREDVLPIVRALPFPARVTGYRAADYNAAVGGASKSQHVRNNAADIWIKGQPNMTSKNARTLMLITARHVLSKADAPIGFGAYTFDVHLDRGGRRTWEHAKHWLDEAKKVT